MKQSVRDKSLKANMATRIANIEALLALQIDAIECPERTVRTLSDGSFTHCARPVTTITEQGDEMVYTCGRCARFYPGDTRPIDDADRIRIALEIRWNEMGI